MSGCGRCGMSGIGLATHGHGEPCITIIRHQEKGAVYESALKDIAELGAENGAAWCQTRARRVLTGK